MERFLGRRLDQHEVVHHIDHDRTNNAIENLELMTIGEHNKVHGKNYPGATNPMAKLTEIQVKEIRATKGKPNLARVGHKYGITEASVSLIVRGKSWKIVK